MLLMVTEQQCAIVLRLGAGNSDSTLARPLLLPELLLGSFHDFEQLKQQLYYSLTLE